MKPSSAQGAAAAPSAPSCTPATASSAPTLAPAAAAQAERVRLPNELPNESLGLAALTFPLKLKSARGMRQEVGIGVGCSVAR